MKLSTILGTIGSGAAIFKTASSMAMVVGAVYLADCRISDRSPQALDRCWMTALPIMGVGAAGRAGFSGGYGVGFNTYNPALRPEDSQLTGRDELGRFKSKP